MSVEDTIVINLDDSQLAAFEMRFNTIQTKSQQTFGPGTLDRTLPGINRELRLILGQLPGMRAAMQVYFALTRIERGIAKYQIGAMGPALLTAVATLIILANANRVRIRKLEMAEQRREAWIRRERGLTKTGYDKLMLEWEEEFKRRSG